MTYGKDYKLADKLQKQFQNRGSEVSGMQASSTAELMRRAEMGRDPRVNCAEQAFRESYSSRNTANRTNTGAKNTFSAGAESRTQRENPYSGSRGSRNYAYTKSASYQKGADSRARTAEDFHREEEAAAGGAEIRVRQRGFSPMFIALLVMSTVMVMVLVLSISEAYKTTGEIARLETKLAELEAEASELKLQLEEKNDIRTIEEIATKELGMVKEDSLQRRYISLSDGEYIELLNTEEESEEQTGGVLLSSIFSSLSKFFERFK